MIPNHIDGNPVYQITVSPNQLFHGINGYDEPSSCVMMKDQHGSKIMVPDFCFGPGGSVLSYRKEGMVIMPDDAWVTDHLRMALKSTQDDAPDVDRHHIHLIRRTEKPYHVSILVTNTPCRIAH